MRVRASYTQTSIQMVGALAPREAERVREAVSSAAWHEVRSAPPLGFVDMRTHLEVDGALYDVMGRDRYRAECARLTQDLMRRPLFAPVVRGRLLRGRPERLLSRLPLAWRLVFDDVGHAEVGEWRDGLEIRLRELPVLVRHDEPFLVGVLGTLEGFAIACATPLTLEVDESRRGLGAIDLRLTW